MNKLLSQFSKRQPFIGYLTAGDGGASYTVDAALAMVDGGVDILEIGLPFSDPIADGPIIQNAMQRALSGGTTPHDVVEILRSIRRLTEAPLVLFSYYNPLLQRGASFLRDLKNAGCDGILTLDLPLEEMPSFLQMQKEFGLAPILIAAPTMSQKRFEAIASHAEGFIYYACQKGTTGIRNHAPKDLAYQIARFKQAATIPLAAGFGIADKNSAKEVLKYADGFIVGSAFVQAIAAKAPPKTLKELAMSLDPR